MGGLSFYLALVLIFFVPMKDYGLYFLSLGCALFLMLPYGIKIKVDRSSLLLFSFISFLFLFMCVRAIYLGSGDFRDFTEIIRFIPSLILLSLLHSKKVDYYAVLSKFILFYLLVVLIISVGQYFLLEIVIDLTKLYSSEYHIENSLFISSRALGLSSGPGQNAALMAVIYAFSLGQYFRSHGSTFWVCSCLLCLFNILLSQSQTGFVVVVGLTVYAIFYVCFRYRLFFIRKFLPFLGLLSVLSVVGLYSLFDRLPYLKTLFTKGFERNSFQKRELKSEYIFNESIMDPFLLVIGHGKAYFGEISSAMDNEWVFYLSVYGLVSMLFIVLFYLYLWKILFFGGKDKVIYNRYNLSVHFTLVVGAVLAYPSSFLLHPTILFFLTLMIVLSLREGVVHSKECYR